MTDTPMTRGGMEAYGDARLKSLVPLGNAATLARRLRGAVERRRRRLVYPSFYALARWFPIVSRWLAERMAPRLPAASMAATK
jgi:hypothetical protein